MIMRAETLHAFSALMDNGNLVEVEEALSEMYNSTLCSQPYLGELTNECTINYFNTIRSITRALRLLEIDLQPSALKKVS